MRSLFFALAVGLGLLAGLSPIPAADQNESISPLTMIEIKALGGSLQVAATRQGGQFYQVRLGPRTTDADLQRLKNDLKGIDSLFLNGTKITDAGLGELKQFERLSQLFLGDTAITDAGLKELQPLRSLEFLGLN